MFRLFKRSKSNGENCLVIEKNYKNEISRLLPNIEVVFP